MSEAQPASDPAVPAAKDESSSDFELTPAGETSSPLELSSDEFELALPDDEVTLGGAPAAGELKGPSSGINLDNPLDSGISLEQGGDGSDEIEFELSLDDDAPPKSGKAPAGSGEFELALDADEAKPGSSSDSEFELTLGVDEPSSEEHSAVDSSSSEFELTLDADDSPQASDSSSDSEFELTLDSSEEAPAATDDSESEFELSLDDSAETEDAAEGQDIFEAGEEGEVAAVDEGDTDLESSDFDIALGEDDVAAEDESGSQVVALDEGEEEGAAPRSGRRRSGVSLDDEEPAFDELAGEGQAEEPEPVGARTEVVSAPWGVVPVLGLLPCVVVMILVGIMGFELVQGMTGYKQPGMVTKAISGLVMPK